MQMITSPSPLTVLCGASRGLLGVGAGRQKSCIYRVRVTFAEGRQWPEWVRCWNVLGAKRSMHDLSGVEVDGGRKGGEFCTIGEEGAYDRYWGGGGRTRGKEVKVQFVAHNE